MSKTVVSTSAAPQAIGPYSQAVTARGVVYCSGQVSLDPSTGELVGESVADETRGCLENLSAVLEAAGTSLAQVVKVTAYLTDLSDFSDFNDAYSQFFPADPPARATVGVAALPKGARVELDCTALL